MLLNNQRIVYDFSSKKPYAITDFAYKTNEIDKDGILVEAKNVLIPSDASIIANWVYREGGDFVFIPTNGDIIDVETLKVYAPTSVLKAGAIALEIWLTATDNSLLKGPTVTIPVEQSLIDNEIGEEPTEDLNILIQMVQEVGSLRDSVAKLNFEMATAEIGREQRFEASIVAATEATSGASEASTIATAAATSASAAAQEASKEASAAAAVVREANEVLQQTTVVANRAEVAASAALQSIAAGTVDLETKMARVDMTGVEQDSLADRLISDNRRVAENLQANTNRTGAGSVETQKTKAGIIRKIKIFGKTKFLTQDDYGSMSCSSVSRISASNGETFNAHSLPEPVILCSLSDNLSDIIDFEEGVVTRECGVYRHNDNNRYAWSMFDRGEFISGTNYDALPGIDKSSAARALAMNNILPTTPNTKQEGFYINENGKIQITLLKSTLGKLPHEMATSAEMESWALSQNMVVVYKLELPEYENIGSKTLLSYDGVTVVAVDSEIEPDISFDMPTEISEVVAAHDSNIVETLLNLNSLATKTENLEQQDLEILQVTWSMDDRIYELEWFIEDNLPNKMNSKGAYDMTKFEQAKMLILAGAYDRATMQPQLEKYAKRGIITQEECDVLIALMDAQELIQGN